MLQLDTVGQRINYIRQEMGLTLEALASRSGLSKSFIWEVEQDRSGISGQHLLQVADALNASVEYLLREGHPRNMSHLRLRSPEVSVNSPKKKGLTYRQTMTLLAIEQSIVARRGGGPQATKAKEDWRALYQGVKPFLETAK